MRVVLLPQNVDGSGCYRCLFPGRELREQRGWDARMAPYTEQRNGRNIHVVYQDRAPDGRPVPIDEWLLTEDFDILLWQQRGEPWTQALAGRLRAQGKKVYVDSDDAWWGLPSWNPGYSRDKREVEAMRGQLAAADGLSVATPALARLYERYQPNIRVIRNYLDWRMWEDAPLAYEQERRRVRVGWMGDARWRTGDLKLLSTWLPAWLRSHPEVEFSVIGDTTGTAHDLLGVPKEQRVSVSAAEFYNMDLACITATIDIGLIPLDLDEGRTINSCKSHLRGLEFAACGIPCIASPSESYRWWMVGDGTHGHLAASPEQWVESLDGMVEDDDRRRRMGRIARNLAELITLQENLNEWEDWLAGSGTHPQPPRPRTPAAAGVGQR